MRSQNRKVNNVGRAGCLGLLTLGLALVNPVSGLAFAGEDFEGADMPAVQSTELMTSAVQIAFSEPVGVSSLTPIAADGASALYSVKATVDVTNSGGYTVYLGSNKAELTGKNSGATINGVTSSTSYEEMPVNSWGYSSTEGETAGTTFSAMPANVRGVVLGSNNSVNIKTDRKTFTLSFAAHIGNDKPADTYENEVTMSVVSLPLEIAHAFNIETMQEMTNQVCSSAEVGVTDRLRDTRDSKLYWVKKMPDNKCWMVQNLDLDLGTSWPDASKSDYETAVTTYTPMATQTKQETPDTSPTNTRSWNFGEWVIKNPSSSLSCGSGKNDLSSCTGQFTNVKELIPSSDPDFYKNKGATVVGNEYDAHYLIGNHYSWNTVTAGTGGTITSGEASGSICPKGWKLPTSNSTAVGSFGGLTATLMGVNTAAKLAQFTGDGYFFVRGGGVYQADYLFSNPGDYGVYWSSTPRSAGIAKSLYFYTTSSINPSNDDGRLNGLSVRCIAR